MKLYWALLGAGVVACGPASPPRGADQEGMFGGGGGQPEAGIAPTPVAGDASRGTAPPARPVAVMVDPTAPSPQPAERLVAAVVGTSRHPTLRGAVTFRPGPNGVQIESRVDGLPPGAHGYHVHVYGDCSDPAAESMGAHLDFAALPSGLGAQTSDAAPLAPDATAGTQSSSSATTPTGTAATAPAAPIHGNLGELTGGRGTSSATETLPLTEDQLGLLVGRAVVIHERPNDPASPPDGAAGPPIACGVIGVANVAARATGGTTGGGTP